MKFWPFPILRNYKTNHDLTDLVLAFANSNCLELVSGDGYYMTIRCELGTLKFWCENAYYAWVQDGTFTDSSGNSTSWKRELPSRYAVKRLAAATRFYQKARFEWATP